MSKLRESCPFTGSTKEGFTWRYTQKRCRNLFVFADLVCLFVAIIYICIVKESPNVGPPLKHCRQGTLDVDLITSCSLDEADENPCCI